MDIFIKNTYKMTAKLEVQSSNSVKLNVNDNSRDNTITFYHFAAQVDK